MLILLFIVIKSRFLNCGFVIARNADNVNVANNFSSHVYKTGATLMSLNCDAFFMRIYSA